MYRVLYPRHCNATLRSYRREVVPHCECTGVPYLLIDVRDTPRWQQLSIPIYPVVGIGDVSFTSDDKELCDSFEGWTCNSYPDMAPRSFYDCFEPDFVSWIKDNAEDQAAMALAATAFSSEVHDELEQPSELRFDTVEGSEDIARVDPGEEAVQQDLELDEAEVHNLPASEQERREGWKQLPQRIRVALRRLHRGSSDTVHRGIN